MKKKIKLDSNGYQQHLIGSAGQHLAMYYLLANNIQSHITEPGSPCDIISEYKDKYIRFQVKTIYQINHAPYYIFSFCGRRSKHDLQHHLDQSDGYILIVLNQKCISFLHKFDIHVKNQLFKSKTINYARFRKSNGIYLEDLTLDAFLQKFEANQEAGNANTGEN